MDCFFAGWVVGARNEMVAILNMVKKKLGTVIAYFAKMPKWPRIWLVSMGLLSIFAFLIARNESSWGAVLPITLMTLLCLPGSVLVVVWILIAAKFFSMPSEGFIEGYILSPGPDPVSDATWHVVVLFFVGYLQWFVIFPALKKLTGKGKA